MYVVTCTGRKSCRQHNMGASCWSHFFCFAPWRTMNWVKFVGNPVWARGIGLVSFFALLTVACQAFEFVLEFYFLPVCISWNVRCLPRRSNTCYDETSSLFFESDLIRALPIMICLP